jgi:tRNA A-37 threonylcarbamoyl transferase component Bud32
MQKRKILIQFKDIVEGSYAPLIQHSLQSKTPLQPEVVKCLLDLWKLLISITPLILQAPKLLWNVRLGIAIAIMREGYELASLLAHIFKACKLCKETAANKTNVILKTLYSDFAFQYILAGKFFNSLQKVTDLADRNLLQLPAGLDNHLKSYNKQYEGNATEVHKLFQPDCEVLGMHVPFSAKSKLSKASEVLKTEETKKIKEEPVHSNIMNSDTEDFFFTNFQANSIEVPSVDGIAVDQPHRDAKSVQADSYPIDEPNTEPSFQEVAQTNRNVQSVDLLGLEFDDDDGYKTRSQPQVQAKPEPEFQLDPLPAIIPPKPMVAEVKQERVHVEENKQTDFIFGQKTEVKPLEKLIEDEITKMNTTFIVDIKDVKVIKKIGAGASAEVFRATYHGTDVAVKVLRTMKGNEAEKLKELKRELGALLLLRHPNLVLFIGAGINSSGAVCLLTEYCSGGALFNLLHDPPLIPLSWKQRCRIALDIAKGMNCLHSYKPPILHRDLKSLNLLLVDQVKSESDPVIVKITDFGLARFQALDQHMTGAAGTFHWMAPEVIMNQPYTIKADVYSYGIVLWEILARRKPYEGINPTMIGYNVVHFNKRPDERFIPPDCPPLVSVLYHLNR